MISLRGFWRRNQRRFLISAGVVGSGYVLYKLYDAHKKKLADLEREQAKDEFVKAHMKANFENIQKIAGSATLRHAMRNLSSSVEEVLDLSQLTERLMKGKGQPNTLTSSEKIALWDQLKVLSFTRMVLSLWAMTVLSLYVQVLVNILGRHLYLETALGSLHEDADLIDMEDQKRFLDSADFLSNQGMSTLVSNMSAAVMEVLKGKQLMDAFSKTTLRDTIVQIIDTFMNTGNPHHWVECLMPRDGGSYNVISSSITGDAVLPDATKFDQLMVKARHVLSSADFGSIVDVSLTKVTNALLEDFEFQETGNSASMGGVPLAKLLSRVAQMDKLLLKEPDQNRFIQVIRDTHELEVFFTLLYSDVPTS